MPKILILNGPNLNTVGTREEKIFGSLNLTTYLQKLVTEIKDFEIEIFQSNSEAELIDKIHNSQDVGFMIINLAGLGHTSVAIRDALLFVRIPFVEVHLSNIFNREKFRHKTYTMDIAYGFICGLGQENYQLALQFAMNFINKGK